MYNDVASYQCIAQPFTVLPQKDGPRLQFLATLTFFPPIVISLFLLLRWYGVEQSPNSRQSLANMTQSPVSLHSLHLGEVFALALGFGLSFLAVAARVYTKMCLTRSMRKEDCQFTSLDESSSPPVVFS